MPADIPRSHVLKVFEERLKELEIQQKEIFKRVGGGAFASCTGASAYSLLIVVESTIALFKRLAHDPNAQLEQIQENYLLEKGFSDLRRSLKALF